jgi:hypothetical protein
MQSVRENLFLLHRFHSLDCAAFIGATDWARS